MHTLEKYRGVNHLVIFSGYISTYC